MSAAGIIVNYRPPGPVSERFQLSPAPVKGIMGPYGSGKTTTLFHEAIRLAARVPWNRHEKTQKRHPVGLVLRDTYRNLERNTLPTWTKFIGPVKAKGFKGGGGGEPATHRFDFKCGTRIIRDEHGEREIDDVVDLTMIFAAVGEHSLKEFMDGFEPSFILINGADAFPREIISYANGRVGRSPDINTFEEELVPDIEMLTRALDQSYESLIENLDKLIAEAPGDGLIVHLQRLKRLIKITDSYSRVVFDCNAPDFDNWLYEDCVEKELYPLFRQPGGRHPQAENRHNLRPGYYENMCRTADEWWIRRFVDNKFGYSRSGTPVYPKFDDTFHVSPDPIPFLPGRKLMIGIDSDRSCAGACMQKDSHGQIRILSEFGPGEDVGRKEGARQFGRRMREHVAEKYPNANEIEGRCDPAGGADSNQDDALSWIETVSNVSGIDIYEAETNAWSPRFDALNNPIMQPIDATRPGLLVSRPDCPMIVRGLMDGFKYKKKQDSTEEPAPRQLKNKFSHYCEAAQYGAMGLSDMVELLGQDRRWAGGPTIVDRGGEPLDGW